MFIMLWFQAITSSGTKKGELFLADVSSQFKNKNITTDVKVDTNSNVSCMLYLYYCICAGFFTFIFVFASWVHYFSLCIAVVGYEKLQVHNPLLCTLRNCIVLQF